MTDSVKTCANCGHSQPTGDFCEACGTRLPMAPAAAAIPAPGAPAAPATAAAEAVPATAASPGPAMAPAPPPPPYAPSPQPYSPTEPTAPQPTQPQPAAAQPAAPHYGAAQAGAYQPPQAPYAPPQYAVPRAPRDDVWGGLADFTFRRFPTPGLARLAWIVTLVWVALSLIVSIWFISDTWGGGRSVFMLLEAIAVAVFTVLAVRVGLEAVLALHRIREKKEQG